MTPANTNKWTKWAVSNFEVWREARRPTDRVADNFFSCSDPIVLSSHLSRYVYETRQTNDEPYPPKTIHVWTTAPHEGRKSRLFKFLG